MWDRQIVSQRTSSSWAVSGNSVIGRLCRAGPHARDSAGAGQRGGGASRKWRHRQRGGEDETAHAGLDMHQPAAELRAARTRNAGLAEAGRAREREQPRRPFARTAPQRAQARRHRRGGSSFPDVRVCFHARIIARVQEALERGLQIVRLSSWIAGDPANIRDWICTNWSGVRKGWN